MTSLFYTALTQTPDNLKKELKKRLSNQEIKLEISEKYTFGNHPYEDEFIGEDASNAMVWIDEYMKQEMKLPVPCDVFQHIRRYNEFNEKLQMEIEYFDEMNEYYEDFEEPESEYD